MLKKINLCIILERDINIRWMTFQGMIKTGQTIIRVKNKNNIANYSPSNKINNNITTIIIIRKGM